MIESYVALAPPGIGKVRVSNPNPVPVELGVYTPDTDDFEVLATLQPGADAVIDTTQQVSMRRVLGDPPLTIRVDSVPL